MLNSKMFPVTKKELTSSSGNIKIPIVILALNSFVMLICCIVIWDIGNSSPERRSNGSYLFTMEDIACYGQCLFWIIVFVLGIQFLLLFVFIPIYCGCAISEERARLTFEMLLTTGYSRIKIILGKVMSGLIIGISIAVSVMPFTAMLFKLYNFRIKSFLILLLVMIVSGVFLAGISICAGAKCSGTKTGSILGLVWVFGICTLSILLICIVIGIKSIVLNWDFYMNYEPGMQYKNASAGSIRYVLLTNPILCICVAIDECIGNGNFVNRLVERFNGVEVFPDMVSSNWVFISLLIQIIMSVLFILWSAKRINPIKNRKAK